MQDNIEYPYIAISDIKPYENNARLHPEEQLGRTCYMCELDPKYVDVIIERWETLTGEKAELISEG